MRLCGKTVLGSARAGVFLLVSLSAALPAMADNREAKQAFGHVDAGSAQPPQPIGFYSKGCQAGAVQLPASGPNWQAMRLSRNRRWGQPELISTIEKLARDAAQKDGWPGLLVGDMSQPRGGPMLTGHASHQVGLDVDIWLTPMPSRLLTAAERENLSAVSVLKKGAFLTLDRNIWSPAHGRLIMRAASYPEVERIFVNPAIKKELCETWKGNPSILGKVRPYYSHDYHFHIRLSCPPGTPNCKSQAAVPAGDGCDKQLSWWFSDEPWRAPEPPKKGTTPPKPRVVTVSDLPNACQAVLNAASERADDNMGVPISATASLAAEKGTPITSLASAVDLPKSLPVTPASVPTPVPAPDTAASADGFAPVPSNIPIPLARPDR
ncbi:penicillin-insensitive murein endopeptidase [Rhizobium sp. L1K21]|uniref:penicillin-insensitive murein endopeptidase n=1 Tax=Rhizobium sp. L1K21 TaxID=2954933 RepID=UPI003593FCB6